MSAQLMKFDFSYTFIVLSISNSENFLVPSKCIKFVILAEGVNLYHIRLSISCLIWKRK